MNKSVIKLFIVVVLLFAGDFAVAQNKDRIVKQFFDAIGGERGWREISTMTMEGVFINYNIATEKPDTERVYKYFKRPNRFKQVFINKKGDTTVYDYDGHVFWRSQNGKRENFTGKVVDYLISTLAFGDFPDLLLSLENTISYKDSLMDNTGKYDILLIKNPYWPKAFNYYFNRNTHLLSRITTDDPASDSKTLVKDYKPINNISFHRVEEVYKDDHLQSKTIRNKIVLNKPMSDDFFY